MDKKLFEELTQSLADIEAHAVDRVSTPCPTESGDLRQFHMIGESK